MDKISDPTMYFGDAEELPEVPPIDQKLIDLYTNFETAACEFTHALENPMLGYYAKPEHLRMLRHRILLALGHLGLYLRDIENDLLGREERAK